MDPKLSGRQINLLQTSFSFVLLNFNLPHIFEDELSMKQLTQDYIHEFTVRSRGGTGSPHSGLNRRAILDFHTSLS